MIRGLAWTLAVLFVAATVLQLVNQLNLVAQPPDLPDSTNLVDRILGQIPYSQVASMQVWAVAQSLVTWHCGATSWEVTQ